MEPVKTVGLWLQRDGGGWLDTSYYFLACGEIETIFNNYDSSLKIIETTATISDTLLLRGDPIFTIASLQGRQIELRYDGKALFVGYIKEAKHNTKTNEINLDITSILDKLNVTISEEFFINQIAPLLANFPAGQRFLETATYKYWDWITAFGWEEYEKWRGEGTLQDHLPPTQRTNYEGVCNMDKLVQAVVDQLTGYDCYLTNEPTPYSVPVGSAGIESGITVTSILNFNTEIVCQNENGRSRTDATWFELISIFNRRGYTLMWNPVEGRFEYKQITFLGSMVNDYRRYPMPESKDILEVSTETRNMRRALKSKCEYCDWYEAFFTDYTPTIDSTGSAVPPPTKITNFSSLNEFVLPDGGYLSIAPVLGEVSLSDSTNMLIFRIFGDDQWKEAFSLIILCDARFTRYYKINTVLTYLLLDSSDTDNQAFYNLTANKIKFIGGVPFSELEILQEIPF